ncbi:MAG: cld2 [Thermoleophilia bacterium]|jgi:chlorite dismutase|nr:cld2 [Thermoleophilia bacterium]
MTDTPESLVRVPHGHVEEGRDAPRQFVSWTCYKVAPEWRRLPEAERERQKAEFAEVVDRWAERMVITTYTAVGIRPEFDLMTWRATPDLELLQESQTELFSTELGSYLETAYLYTGTTKGSQYTKAAEDAGFKKARPLAVTPKAKKYFIVYPFVKRREWYSLPKEERGRMMRDHAVIGRQWPGVTLNTAFSFGMDDQEFMTAFETDSVHDFVDLMMAMRETESSGYTERDVPIFTTIRMDVRQALDTLGGVRSAVLSEA